ncbi:MAG: hypothetical protein ACK44Y_01345, partial [Novosphingobium sp.]
AKLFNKIMRSKWYQEAFPECRPERPNKLMDWYTTEGGNRLATSIQGSILSRGADIIILDDPNKGQEIHSKVSRDKVTAVYDQVISTRLNEPKKGAIICCMQRLHPGDLAGHLLELEPWDEVVMPAMATEREIWDLGNGETMVREPGDLLQEFHIGQAELDLKRRNMGMLAFEAQYQQHPVPSEGGVVKRRWLQYYEQVPDPLEFTLVSW